MAIVPGLDADLPSWQDVRSAIEFTGVLVGNGASRAVWGGFEYDSLYNIARNENQAHRLSDHDAALFEALGNTRNFEHVLAGLATTRHVTGALGLDIPVIPERYTSIQSALAEAVRRTHVPWASVPGATLQTLRTELLTYKFVYSTNYDLLVYWAVMHENQGGFKDFFWGQYFDLADTELWGKATAVLYLHGGLHLYRTVNGRTRKRHAEYGANLLDLFGTPMDEEATPLFISEGSAADKLASIHRSDYLAFAYTELARHKGPICVFGHSLSDMDDHIVQALRQSRVRDIAMSIRPGDPEAVIERKGRACEKLAFTGRLLFFDATTHPLGGAGLLVAPAA
jgi:hypothetical protein